MRVYVVSKRYKVRRTTIYKYTIIIYRHLPISSIIILPIYRYYNIFTRQTKLDSISFTSATRLCTVVTYTVLFFKMFTNPNSENSETSFRVYIIWLFTFSTNTNIRRVTCVFHWPVVMILRLIQIEKKNGLTTNLSNYQYRLP